MRVEIQNVVPTTFVDFVMGLDPRLKLRQPRRRTRSPRTAAVVTAFARPRRSAKVAATPETSVGARDGHAQPDLFA